MGIRLPDSVASPHGSSLDRRRLLGLLVVAGGVAAGVTASDPAAAKKKKKKYPLVINTLSMETEAGDRFEGSVVFTRFGVNDAVPELLAFGTFKGEVTRAGGAVEAVEANDVEISLGGIQPGQSPAGVGAQSFDRGTLELLLGMTWATILGSLFQFEAQALPAPLGSKSKKVAKKQAKAVTQAMEAQEAGNLAGMAAALNALAKTY